MSMLLGTACSQRIVYVQLRPCRLSSLTFSRLGAVASQAALGANATHRVAVLDFARRTQISVSFRQACMMFGPDSC